MKITPLDSENASAHYDPIKYILFVYYRGTLSSQVTVKAYQWIQEALNHIDVLEGVVFDFQNVTKFDTSHPLQAHTQLPTRNFDLNRVPTVLVVANDYQRRLIQATMETSTIQAHQRLVMSFQEAFAFINYYNEKLSPLQTPHPKDISHFSTEDVTCYYDPENYIVYVTYFGVITPEVTADVYAWMPTTFVKYDVREVRGGIFNFCHVTQFSNANLGSVRKTSSNLNTKYDMSHIAVALLVGNMRQEQMVKVAMKVTPQEERKRVVKSYDDAYRFINTFQTKRTQVGSGD